jgi:hypothetical protein
MTKPGYPRFSFMYRSSTNCMFATYMRLAGEAQMDNINPDTSTVRFPFCSIAFWESEF